MFNAAIYQQRRNELKRSLKSGLALFSANQLIPMNYSDNTFHFRQDSTFLYYFGINDPGIAGIIDVDNDRDILFADELGIEDIIWMGRLKTFREKAAESGIEEVEPLSALSGVIKETQKKSRQIHYIKPYQAEIVFKMMELLDMNRSQLLSGESLELIKATVVQRSVKGVEEIAEIEKAHDVTRLMHITAMKKAAPGVIESDISGDIEGIALSGGAGVSFPVILSVRGEILHNHSHSNIMQDGDLLVNDSGAESMMNYAADITRTFPVNGKYSTRQKEVYEIVLKAQMDAIDALRPGIMYRDVHLLAARVIADGLKALGLMKGDMEEAVQQGAHALFFPHGLGHMMGLDVHDMENYGEDWIGYDEMIQRSEQFGLAYLRLAKKLKPGFVLTVEPGIYFIPDLINQWKKTKKFENFIEYEKVEKYIGFGGIRIEDDILITQDGNRVLGQPIPKTVKDVENTCQSI